MTPKAVYDICDIIISKETKKPLPLNPAADLRDDLGMDSLGAFELCFALEAKFGIEVDDDELASIKKVSDVHALVLQKVNAHAPK